MDTFIIQGGNQLNGSVKISGSKNASLPMMAACVLTEEDVILNNVPDLRDIRTMKEILKFLGVTVEQKDTHTVSLNASKLNKNEAPYDLVRKMRASVCLLGPLLARTGSTRISMPGGCVIGPRPVDLHLKGIKGLGASVSIEHGYIKTEGKLYGADIFLGGRFGSSVTATANVLMAACLAKGVTYIESAAQEPEIIALAKMLVKMGAQVEGAGSHVITVKGVQKLHGCEIDVIPDRIETGTFMMAAAATGGKVALINADAKHIRAVTDKLLETGLSLKISSDSIEVERDKPITSADIITLPFPGFPTDLQAQMMALMTNGGGLSVITEKVYPERFMHISELNRMGADIKLETATAIVKGVKKLSGASVMASDLRASAGLVIAGLIAEGETQILRVYHIDRGYEKIEEKLALIGADIKRGKEIEHV
ncbi:MAG: UDP-N-acetylglucosamine 1-carboxyvinyltransferase [Candidatus Aureabacteria bacterium]|nr:UDP-N-acetylglucosamine 1-carboxyvinyltransferase [Candidatus Auribacterota bacterium]